MIPSLSNHTDETNKTQSVSENDSDGLLPGCWLETPWNPSTIGTVTEQSRLIDLIPLLQTQWIRIFLFWIVLIAITLVLGIFGPSALSALKLPSLNFIELGTSGLDRWLEGIILFLASGTTYLSWCIRRQKPECFTQGYILLIITAVCLYMSLDRTVHIVDCIFQGFNSTLNPPLDEKGCLFWESLIYGILYLALLSRLLIEFSGAPMAQTFLLLATTGYVCSYGVWFAPEDWNLPLPIPTLSGCLTLLSDFFLFWSMINYARFLLLDGFGLTGYGWRKAMSRYKYPEKHYIVSPQTTEYESSISKNNKLSDKPESVNIPQSATNIPQSATIKHEQKSTNEQKLTDKTDTTNETISIPLFSNTTSTSITTQTTTNPELSIIKPSLVETEKTGSSAVLQPSTIDNNCSTFTTTSTTTTSTEPSLSTFGQPPQVTPQPAQQYSQPTSLFPQPQLGIQQYPQSYNQQPYPSQAYNSQYNNSYGVQVPNNPSGYGQPQQFFPQSYGQPLYPQSYFPQQTGLTSTQQSIQQPIQQSIQQSVPQGRISQPVQPQPIQQPVPQDGIFQPVQPQPIQPSVQSVVQQSAVNTTVSTQEPLNLSTVSIAPLEIQREFRALEERIHRPLTHEEKKAVVRQLIKARQGK